MRVDPRAIRAAEQFDVNLANRLRNGIVSDLDLREARGIYDNALQAPVFDRQWETGNNGWNQNVDAAQFLYEAVAAQHARQDPYVTQRETQLNYRHPTGASERWSPVPVIQPRVFNPVLRDPLFDRFPRRPVFQPPIFEQRRPVFLPNDFRDYGHHGRQGHHGRDPLATLAGVGIRLGIWNSVRNRGCF